MTKDIFRLVTQEREEVILLEKQIEEWMRKEIEKIGGKFFKFVSPGNDGVPDRIAILPGALICFVELKRDGKELRPLQEYVCGQLKELGCNVLKVRGIEEANRAIMWMKGKAGRSDPDGKHQKDRRRKLEGRIKDQRDPKQTNRRLYGRF